MKNFLIFILSIFIFSSCYSKQIKDEKMNTYKSVSMEQGLNLMENDSNYVLLDVRTIEEYNDGHIPNAIQLTNETFTKEEAENIIPSKDTVIYVYCRSGRRSKLSSQKLINFGYKNVIEIGGIIDYKGKLEK